MKSYSVVVLNRFEKEKLQRVLPSLGVGFPKLDREDKTLRALYGVAKHGVELTHEVISRAIVALDQQRAQCEVEAQREYWLQHAVTPAGREALDRGELLSSPLITDVAAMIDMLVDTRELQHREAVEALAILSKARTLATPRPELDDEEDDE